MYEFYEFFSGGGMVRAGLGREWRCLFANDFDRKKSQIYRDNWGAAELKTADVGSLTTKDISGQAHLAWASFPCQDLSLAGAGAGLKGERSGTFWPFWSLIKGLADESRAPRLIALENVCGTLTSHGGKDFATICDALALGGYRFGALVIDAVRFVPARQSTWQKHTTTA
jgi:DNA (cytosine-5)-methyltransferase 1